MDEIIVANLKLQLALQEQLLSSTPFVPNYTSQVRNNTCLIQPPPTRCCQYNSPTELEMLAQQPQIVPQNKCCWRDKR